MRKEKKQLVKRCASMLLVFACVLVLSVMRNQSSALAAGAQGDSSALLSQAAMTMDSLGGMGIGIPVSYAVNIITQPESQTVVVGKTATFTVYANVPGIVINYQWQYRRNSSDSWKDSKQKGNTTEKLEVSTTAGMHGYQFRCVIDDGGITSPKTTNVVTLKLRPCITTWPKDTSVTVGSTAEFTLEATGAGPLTYQWQYRKNENSDWKPSGQSGNKTNTLSVATTENLHGYQFRCCVTDKNNQKSYTNTVTLTVKPKITKWPKDTTAAVGSTAKFTMAATGKTPLTYQWQYRKDANSDWKPSRQSGNKTPTLSVAVTSGLNGYQFRCYVTDGNGQRSYTNTVTLSLKAYITKHPTDKTVSVGNTAKFSVTAVGKAPLTYQWQYRSNPAAKWKPSGQSGNKTAVLSVATTTSLQGYQFRCVVTDGDGNKAYSKVATLYMVDIPINSTTFPDAEFRSRVKNSFDTDRNGKLSAAEINAAKRINVEEDDVCSLKGVEFLTEIVYLNCGYTSLGTLNVSANKKLEYLDCYSCGLTSLNVSGCTKLVDLQCYWNRLTSLDLSTNTALESVDCSGNKLTKLDVTKLTALFQLACVENDITELDLTNNWDMESVCCDEDCVCIVIGNHIEISHDWWN